MPEPVRRNLARLVCFQVPAMTPTLRFLMSSLSQAVSRYLKNRFEVGGRIPHPATYYALRSLAR